MLERLSEFMAVLGEFGRALSPAQLSRALAEFRKADVPGSIVQRGKVLSGAVPGNARVITRLLEARPTIAEAFRPEEPGAGRRRGPRARPPVDDAPKTPKAAAAAKPLASPPGETPSQRTPTAGATPRPKRAPGTGPSQPVLPLVPPKPPPVISREARPPAPPERLWRPFLAGLGLRFGGLFGRVRNLAEREKIPDEKEAQRLPLAERMKRLRRAGSLLSWREVARRRPVGTELTDQMRVEESEDDHRRRQRAAAAKEPQQPKGFFRQIAEGRIATKVGEVWHKYLVRKPWGVGQAAGEGLGRMMGGGPKLVGGLGGAGGTAAVGAANAVAFAGALVVATKMLYRFSERVTENSRELAQYSPRSAMAMARYDWSRKWQDVQTGQATSRSMAAQIDAFREFREASQGLRRDFATISNTLMKSLADIGTMLTKIGDAIAKWGWRWWTKYLETKPTPGERQPFEQLVEGIASGRWRVGEPRNPAPGER